MYSINFTVTKKKFCLSLHYNGANSYLFVNGTEIYMEQIVIYLLMVQKFINLQQKILKLQQVHYVQENTSKDWSTDNKKKTGFNGYIYDFSVDYDGTDIDNIKDIHKYLMKKNNIV